MTKRLWFGNLARSLDNKMGEEGKRTKISNQQDFGVVHQFRNHLAGIVIGSNTLVIDNPSLRTKREYVDAGTISHPIPIIFDRRGRLNASHRVLKYLETETLIHVSNNSSPTLPDTVEVINFTSLTETVDRINQRLTELGRSGPVMVEGGRTLLKVMIEMDIVKKVRIFTSDVVYPKSDLRLLFQASHSFHLLSTSQIANGVEQIFLIRPV